MNCICDKIEDTAAQLNDKGQYQEEKRKMIQDKEKNEFKPVEEGKAVVNLGSFGNRKKKMEEGPTQQQPTTITLPASASFKKKPDVESPEEADALKVPESGNKPGDNTVLLSSTKKSPAGSPQRE